MELQKFIKQFQEERRLIAIIIVAFVMGGLIFKVWYTQGFTTKLDLGITRSSVQKTNDYRYDDYYRLQADEKFAETVTQWLSDANVAGLILGQAKINTNELGLRQLASRFKTEKLSSQFISVRFAARSEREGRRISDSIGKVLREKNKSLNSKQQSDEWFEIIVGEPLIKKNDLGLKIVLLFSFALGAFVAVWTVMIKRYLKDENRN